MRASRFWIVGAVVAAALAGCATANGGGGDDDDDTADAASAADANTTRPDSGGGGIDAASSCPTTPCDLIEQCGCVSPTVCDLDLANLGETTCRTVTTPGTEMSACSTLSDCAGGYVCVSGSCSRYCAEDADCMSARRKCIVTLESGGTPIAGAVTCSSACEPPDAAAGMCPPGFSCHLSFLDPDANPESGDETAFATCGQAGSAGQGDVCASNNDCALDHLCVNTGTLQCVRMCTFTPAGGECPLGTTCANLIPEMNIAGIIYGACL